MTTFKKGDLIIFSHETEHPVSLVTNVNPEDDSVDVILFLRNDSRGKGLLNVLEEESVDIHQLLRKTNMLRNDMSHVFNHYFGKGHIIASAESMNPNAFTLLTSKHIDRFVNLHPYRNLLLTILNKNPGRTPSPTLRL